MAGAKPGQPCLVSLQISAWSLKARWALKLCGIDYKTIPYTPLLGTWWLRWKLGDWKGRMTTPVLLLPEGPIQGSLRIARWAGEQQRAATGPQLFPESLMDEICRCDEAGDLALYLARAHLLAALRSDPALGKDLLPPFLQYLGPLGHWMAAVFLAQYAAKYEDLTQLATTAKVHNVLKDLQQRLRDGNQYVLGSFTYADISMAVALQVVEPIGAPHSKMPEERRKKLTNHAFKKEFQDLLDWRQGIFDAHFPKSTGRS